jgi:iron complex outermembrane recepter protein
MDIIERVEIYRGPATVLFGDNAVAGAINIITRKGEGKPSVKAGVTAGSYNTFAPRISMSGKEGIFAYHVLSSSYESDGYRQNNNIQMKDLFGSFTLDVFKNLAFSLKTGTHKDRYGLPGPLSFGDLASGQYDRTHSKRPFDFATTEDNFADLGADIKLLDDVTLAIYGSYRDRHGSAHYVNSNYETMRTLETYGFTPKLTVAKPLWGLRNSLVTGFDYYRSPTTGTDYGPPWTNSLTRITKSDAAFYVNDEISPIKDLLVGFGYRLQKTSWDMDYTDYTGFLQATKSTVHEQKDAYRASLNYLLGKKGNVFVTWAKGFRMPATDELFSPFSLPPVNQDLKPQEAREVDVGIRYRIADRIGTSVTYFQTRTDNEIYYNPLTYINGNYDKTKRQGIEAAAHFALIEGLNLDLQYSYTEAKFDGGVFDGNRIPLVPQDKFSAKLTYRWQDLTASAVLTYLGPRYLISDQQNQLPMLPGVTLLDFTAKYAFKGFEALFGIKNITGKQYSEYGVASYPFGAPPASNFYPSAERQFVFGVSYGF